MNAFDYTCSHRTTDLKLCVTFAFFTSSMFVINLYLLVPKSVQELPREDVMQIKWRIFAVITTIAFNLAIYPIIFCDYNYKNGVSVANNSDVTKKLASNMGFSVWTWPYTFIPLIHAIILYFGSYVSSFFYYTSEYQNQMGQGSQTAGNLTCIKSFMKYKFSLYQQYCFTWGKIRDLFIAPLAEEVTFRSCLVTPFMHSNAYQSGKLSLTKIVWCVPLFFGVAHLHHAIKRLKSENSKIKIVLTSAFQFLYTTIFGAYASFCFIKTGSLLGVVILHSFCNFMGLPSMSIFSLHSRSSIQINIYKKLCLIAYVIGIIGFWLFFKSSLWDRINR